jgi:hypothetical protein
MVRCRRLGRRASGRSDHAGVDGAADALVFPIAVDVTGRDRLGRSAHAFSVGIADPDTDVDHALGQVLISRP